ncbi:hypothetical protein G647_02594 [Cladophialophora carrionii CBS 160.54]|uniref:C2H2-type domain-containing protein n=1 Tax=Cladophialophora carrionii CBS 160.54 TaxID=1279043 RepID=V9DHK2_9EURO|nr:uncharacterized protein G647_02594 [Cladophialophora carrionii CBS 160.54]ETI25818.1 hypothetical protein G647_02594 [Cladophialophora carrionii CBS 160.54]
MIPTVGQTPRNSISSSNEHFLDLAAFENYSFDLPEGEPQYTLASSASVVNPRHLDSSAVDTGGVPSHRTGPDPWTHVDATVGPKTGLPDTMNSNQHGLPSGHLRTPTHALRPSSVGGRMTFEDSAYATASRKSQHASEAGSISEHGSDIMEQRNTNSTPTPTPYSAPLPGPTSSHSSTATLIPSNGNLQPSQPGRSPTRRPPRKQTELECPDCDYAAKTPSDLKKHSARHKREYKCTVRACPQSEKGFATVNDRDRHMKAVHRISNRPSKSYKCFAEGCNRGDKEWPRLDNFKQHLRKMHEEQPLDDLLQASNKWWEGQEAQQQAEADAASHARPHNLFASSSAMSVSEQFEAYQRNYSDSNPSYMSLSSGGSDMLRSVSHGNPAHPADPASVLDPRLRRTQQFQRRSLSGPLGAGNPQRHLAVPLLNTSLAPPQLHTQKTRSHADYSAYQDPSQVSTIFTNPTVNYLFSSGPSLDPSPFAARAGYSVPGGFVNEQPRRVKKARTVAGPDIKLYRMADFGSPQKVQPVPEDDRASQDAYLGYVGSNPAADNVPTPSPHQASVAQALEDSPKSKLHKRLEDDINSFLVQHNSKAGNQPLSEEELYKSFRLSLGSSDTLTSCDASHVGPLPGPADVKQSPTKYCPATRETYFVCPVCKKPKKRQSELNKHMNRHSKPYGCVFDGCHKTFGSKNDWKRHEQTQHEQQECWRCHLCFEVFFRDESYYITHMSNVHSTHRPEESARQHRIARNYQGRFWCGFCREIIKHMKTDMEAINFRFDHIANHFTKDKMLSKDWVELSGKGKTKQQDRDQQSKTATEGGEDFAGMSQDTSMSTPTPTPTSPHNDSSPMQRDFSHQSSSSEGLPSSTTIMQDLHSMMGLQIHTGPLQRQSHPAPEHAGPQPRRDVQQRRTKYVYCCHCGEITNSSLSDSCMPPCNHRFCLACRHEEHMDDEP